MRKMVVAADLFANLFLIAALRYHSGTLPEAAISPQISSHTAQIVAENQANLRKELLISIHAHEVMIGNQRLREEELQRMIHEALKEKKSVMILNSADAPYAVVDRVIGIVKHAGYHTVQIAVRRRGTVEEKPHE